MNEPLCEYSEYTVYSVAAVVDQKCNAYQNILPSSEHSLYLNGCNVH